MISALWTGISGLATQQKALDNEAHNIANVNTVGYKATRISFADQLYQDKIGKGSKVLDAEKIFTQGGRKQTGVAYDMALNGEGFFAVSNKSSAGTSEVFYTRAGNFRMGDNGTLQDAQGNEVQGWALSPIDPQKDVLSTNPDTSVFTDLYTELLSSKVVKYSNYIETVTAKATDYTETAVKDAEIIFNGGGAKSKAAKTSDVDLLIQSYTSWLEKLQAEPDALSSSSRTQVSQLNFKGDTLKKENDQIYVFIDGDKIAQDFINKVADETLTPASVGDLTGDGIIDASDADLAASRIATYKALADKISEKQGYTATTITNGTAYDSSDPYSNTYSDTDIFKSSTKDLDVLHGMIQIKGLVPGVEFTIKEHAEVSGTQVTQGSLNISGSQTAAEEGSGLGAVTSAKQALSDAIVGKQRDVYRPEDLGIEYNATSSLITSPTEFDYSISIYDKDLGKNITLTAATSPLAESIIGTPLQTVLENLAEKINSDINLKSYIEAEVINGNLVVKTLDSNSDVEFSGTLKSNETTYTPLSNQNETYTTTASNDTASATDSTLDLTTMNIPAFPVSGQFVFSYVQAGTTINAYFSGSYANLAAITTAMNTAAAALGNGVTVSGAGIIAHATDVITSSKLSFENDVVRGIDGTTLVTVSGTGGTASETIDLSATTLSFPVKEFTFNYVDTNVLVGTQALTVTGPFATMDEIGIAMQNAANLVSTGSASYNSTTDILTLTGTSITSLSVNIDQADRSVLDLSSYTYPLTTNDTIEFTYNDNGTVRNVQINPSAFVDADALGEAIATLSGNKVTYDSGSTSLIILAANSTDTMTTSKLVITTNNAPSTALAILDKNADYSGRQGAGAEFMEIVTTINQTTTQDSLQLRLDTLNISDSAFGEFSVDETGLVTMKQDGAEYAIGQIAVAKFNNMRGLEAIGNNLYQKTNNSGDAIFNVNNNKTALIESKSLELSTADLSESLVNLMVFQRAFEANAKSITTADSLLTTLIALKR